MERLQTAKERIINNTKLGLARAGEIFPRPLFDFRPVKGMVDRILQDLEIEIPEETYAFLKDKSASAVLVSNYPPDRWDVVYKTFKVASHTMGKKKFRAIVGEDILPNASWYLKLLGVDKVAFPSIKTKKGRNTLDPVVEERLKKQLEKPGTVLWQSITGQTENNGLVIKDCQPGAAKWSATYQIPIIPMADITDVRNEKEKIVKVRFGRPIPPPNIEGINSTTTLYEVYSGHMELVMFRIAELLPEGKRGGFEDLDGWRAKLSLN